MNQTIVTGNVGAEDGVLGKMPSNKPVLNFNFATNEVYTDRDGKKQTTTTWFKVAVFGDMATRLAPDVVSGRGAIIIGRVKAKAWKAENGDAKADLVLTVDRIYFDNNSSASRDADGGTGDTTAEVEPDYAPGAVGAVDDENEEFPHVD